MGVDCLLAADGDGMIYFEVYDEDIGRGEYIFVRAPSGNVWPVLLGMAHKAVCSAELR